MEGHDHKMKEMSDHAEGVQEITENKTSLPDLAQRKGKKKIRLPRSGRKR